MTFECSFLLSEDGVVTRNFLFFLNGLTSYIEVSITALGFTIIVPVKLFVPP